MVRLELQRLAVAGLGLGMAPEGIECAAKIAMRTGVLRYEADGAGEGRDSLRQFPHGLQRQPQKCPPGGMSRATRRHAACLGFQPLPLPGLMQGHQPVCFRGRCCLVVRPSTECRVATAAGQFIFAPSV